MTLVNTNPNDHHLVAYNEHEVPSVPVSELEAIEKKREQAMFNLLLLLTNRLRPIYTTTSTTSL
jgi:hypothetical protein